MFFINVGHYETFPDLYRDPSILRPYVDELGIDGIRMMDATKTNNSMAARFEDLFKRSTFKPEKMHRQDWSTFRGMTPDEVVAFIKTLDTHVWLNVPHMFNFSEIVRFVQFYETRIPSHLHIYWEFSNELWNGQFWQYYQAAAKMRYYAYNISPMTAIIEYVAQGIDMLIDITNRGQVVVAGWNRNNWYNNELLKRIKRLNGEQLFTVAPYFRQDDYDQVMSAFKQCAQLAANYELPIGTYELGQDYQARTLARREFNTKLNRSSEMAAQYSKFLNDLNVLGCSVFSPYTLFSRYGQHNWGAVEITDDNVFVKRPKYYALKEFTNK